MSNAITSTDRLTGALLGMFIGDALAMPHFRRRFKLHSRAQAYHHLPTSKPYGSYGLFKLPTTARWRKTHAL